MRRYVVAWYAVGRWQRIGRTWWTRWGARRAAQRVQRTAVCHATKIIRLPQHGCARVRPQGQSGAYTTSGSAGASERLSRPACQ
ncbi:MAG: hypothetical protein OXQ31_22350 [Spirochaetaceae bacterium]|nr:hypothetical protein [Spirochaetaceae bacterium]MDD9989029.1 hypothetical protein [Spirochaetaceae bacterium]